MKYLKPSIFLFLVVFAFQVTACAQDEPVKPSMTNDQIAVYVRKALNIPANISVTVKENPESKAVPGSYPITIQFRSDRVNQDQEAWVTKGNFLVIGRTFDMSIDPYKKNLEKINLSNAPVTGASDAKVTIVEYSDFQCPYCSAAYVTVKDLLKVYEGKVKVVYKHLPLISIHDWAQDAAVASVCVYQQNPQAFWAYSDYFFTNQKGITKATFGGKLQQFSTDSKLDYAALQKCMADPSIAQKVTADTAEASGLGLNSTPSFVVNGRTVVGALPEDQFKQVIDEALKAQ